jgi:threonine aldolase
MKTIDLRSDTVTLPTEAMRKAIYDAELGDDVFGGDPTVNRLEETAAERLGKEAALLVPSGSMGNLVCLLTQCARGEEVILGDKAHLFLNEAGSMSAIGSIHPHTVPNLPDGTMGLEEIEAAIRGDHPRFPRTRLVCLENTHNSCYGAPLTPEYTDSVAELVKGRGLLLHLDAARIFNAAVALKVDVKELTRHADSLSFCLSKGLSCPVGSVVCGSKEFIAEARRSRKVLGGGMRQAGIIAAAGIVALEEMVDRLAEDHENARRLAEGIALIPGLSSEPERVKTDILYFERISDGITDEELVSRLDEKGIQFLCLAPGRFRMVTHYGITASDVDRVIDELESVFKESRS